MSLTIKDAATGNMFKVGKDGEIQAHSFSLTRAAWTSWKSAETYQIASGEFTVPNQTDVPPAQANCHNTYPALWYYNTSKTKALVAHLFLSFHDGGLQDGAPAANPGSALMKMKNLAAFGAMPPTANFNPAVAARRTNGSNGSAPDVSAFAWNGVGNGLTMTPGAVQPGWPPTAILQAGKVPMESDDIAILPPGFPYAILLGIAPIGLAAGETMQAQLSWIGYHVDPSDMFP